MKKVRGVIRQRNNQPYLVFPRGIAQWLVPGATLDVVVENGRIVARLVRGADRPKRPDPSIKRAPSYSRRKLPPRA